MRRRHYHHQAAKVSGQTKVLTGVDVPPPRWLSRTTAKEVQRRAPELTAVQDRIPRCFSVSGYPFVASEWGTLHPFAFGQIGPPQGVIWFRNGQYIGRGYNGLSLQAIPNSAC